MTELSKEARALLEAARDQYGPAAGDKARVLAKIKAAAAAPAPAATASTAATSGVAAKLVVLGVAALIAGALVLRQTAEEPAKLIGNEAGPTKSTPERAKFVASESGPAKSAPEERAKLDPKRSPAKSTAPDAAKFVASEAGPTNSAPDSVVAIEAEPVIEAAPVVDPPNELVLLREARIALRDGRAEEALALAATHERTYPSSALTEERLATQALAACTIGQYEQADRAIAALVERAPASEHLARIHRACKNREKKSSQ